MIAASSITRIVFILCLLSPFFCAPPRAGDELPTLNLIQERHEQMHGKVAPAVVAVQCQTTMAGVGCYGTGVVVSAEGLVLTCSTVVPSGSRNIQIFFPDGKVAEAKVLARDEGTESCLLQVVCPAGETRKPLPFVEMADSSRINVGELAYTAGNPFRTISRDGQVAWSVGTISGIYTIASADEQSRYRGLALETDAAVNPGSDGGPLLDSNGRLLGILSLCYCETRWLGTAIPAHLIHQALPPLRNVALYDPRGRAGDEPVAVSYEKAEPANAARAIPDAMRHASRGAAGAMVKLLAKRAGGGRETAVQKESAASRLRQRPEGPVSGVIFDPEGYVLTSAFNIEGDVIAIEAKLANGATVPAKLLGRNLGLDVAVLKLSGSPGEYFPALPLCNDPALVIGRFVTVLGSSEAGPAPTRTTGIVSALKRLDDCAVQTDALINYGNSGGPVVDLFGRLVGIAAHVQNRADWSQQNSGVGFFTRSDKILACMDDLKAARDIRAPSGAFVSRLQESAADIRGVKLETVVPGTAASAAKLQPGDIVLAIDGMDTHSPQAFVSAIKAHKAGDSIDITYQRGAVTGRAQTVLSKPPVK